MSGIDIDDDTTWVALCAGCAEQAGLAEDSLVMEPNVDAELACAQCSAIIAGFSYRVPERAWTGMSPGPG